MPDDTLDRLMTTLAVHLHTFAVCRIEPGWRLRLGRMDQITIHYVLEGSGTLRLEEGGGAMFAPHSIILVPPDQAQSLAGPGEVLREARDEDNCVLLADGLIAFRAGEDGARGDEERRDGARADAITCICGAITASFAGALGLLEGLRDPILVPTGAGDPLRRHFDHILEELAMPGFGTRALTEALMKVCLVTILRRQLEEPGADRPIFVPLRDRRLSAAVAAIVDMPAGSHTVASLAEVAGMSRTAFAQRFVETYGRTPIDFLQAVRLRHAAHLLRTTDVPVKVIASAVGYRSRSQFSHAFRERYELDPSTFRRMSSAAREEDLQVRVPGRVGGV